MSMGLRSKPIGFSMGFGYAENPCFFNGVGIAKTIVSSMGLQSKPIVFLPKNKRHMRMWHLTSAVFAYFQNPEINPNRRLHSRSCQTHSAQT